MFIKGLKMEFDYQKVKMGHPCKTVGGLTAHYVFGFDFEDGRPPILCFQILYWNGAFEILWYNHMGKLAISGDRENENAFDLVLVDLHESIKGGINRA